MVKIMVVDDEKPIADIIQYNLEREGFKVVACYDGEKAVKTAYAEKPDLILLDVMLPKINGFDACKKIREFTNCPIIMLTAKEEERDKVTGLEQGADDYVTKPFGHKELQARINAHLRRYKLMGGQSEEQNPNTHHGLEIIPETYEVKRDGETIELTQREFDLLMFLIQNSGKVYSREQLLELVWGFDYYGDVRTVDVTIHRLREKIEKNPSKAEYILTKRGFGYYFRRN
ncbi:response regulator transcription factor [Alkalicella caledoniensis]|uniref:Stage 0 sporulation protein A homolog n=1 Tax=Alkalicella caledoniensis TaxID=2731377 RepID=A0A7G9W8M5_ALKCA|nr:response regulator [Alkalicella caledoniensis]QNO15037.1 response regulator transcription factor [Alkalicella caledoniensis]